MQNKKKETKEKQLRILIIVFVMLGMIFSVLALCKSIIIFETGYHNADLGQNMRYLEERLDINLIDVSLSGIELTSGEVYRLGMSQIKWGFISGLLSAAAFGYMLIFIIFEMNIDNSGSAK